MLLSLVMLQTGLLTYRQWNPVRNGGYFYYGYNWADYVLMFINFLYTIEIALKVVVYGLYDDSQMYETLNIDKPVNEIKTIMTSNLLYRGWKKVRQTAKNKSSKMKNNSGINYQIDDGPPKKLNHSFTVLPNSQLEMLSLKRAYLRSSWNRVDFVSCVTFWISLLLSIHHYDARENIMIFRAVSCLRIMRLCNLTVGTSTILKALKRAMPQLIDVAIFVGCFWIFFGIIGVQSFKSSFRRHCVWTNPDDPTDTYINDGYCGSALASNGTALSYMLEGNYTGIIKGYRCPINSQCVSGDNPYNGTVSFDNIFQSLELVFVIMSANTFTDLMYDTMDSDQMAACLFFIFSIFILTVWLANVFIAVVVSSFNITRMESEEQRKNNASKDPKPPTYSDKLHKLMKKSMALKIYYRFQWIFVLVIVADLSVQCTRHQDMSASKTDMINRMEVIVTCILAAEILLRFFLHFPQWRLFFRSKQNMLDLALAIITLIIVVKPIRDRMGYVYQWFTVFQIARFYRIVLAITITKNLWTKVVGNGKTIFDLALFFFVLTSLVCIIVSRYFEGAIPLDQMDNVTFTLQTIPNTFVALYVITSTENWTDILYAVQEYSANIGSRVFGAIFLIGWFVLSNMIILNIFIAVIAENLEVSEEEKRTEQIKQFIGTIIRNFQTNADSGSVFSSFKKKVLKTTSQSDQVEKAVVNLLLSGSAMNDFLNDMGITESIQDDDTQIKQLSHSKWRRFIQVNFSRAIGYLKNPFFPSKNSHHDINTYLRNLRQNTLAKSIVTDRNLLASKQDQFLKENPKFNNVLYFLEPRHPLRRFCQRIVRSSYGERIDGVEPNNTVREIFIGVMFTFTIAMVVLACYTTPLYRKEHNLDAGLWNWTVYAEIAFVLLFSFEFSIKCCADGLLFTPNGYLRSSWNIIDMIVLVSLWINIISTLKHNANLTRVVRGLQALRALRLLTISETAKSNFHNTMISGIWKIVNAALVSLCLLIPYSIWGLNLFSGRLGYCVDGVSTRAECVNEYSGEVFNWDVLSPNVYTHPILEFNRFATSFLTLFEITSLEGWVDLLINLMNSTGVGTVPRAFASPYNAIYIMSYNFFGIVFILTLFISIIISNYSQYTGRAYYTSEQVAYYQVKKYLSQIKASKRRDITKLSKVRRICYELVVNKNVYWASFINIILAIHVLALLVETYPLIEGLDTFRVSAYMTTSSIMLFDFIMLYIALGFTLFVGNKWNVYSLVVIVGAFITTIINYQVPSGSVFTNINKLFLVGMLSFIIPRSNKLSQLLKFASASFPILSSLIFTWLVVFLVFAIALNQIFGLTRVGPNGSGNINLRTVTKSLILLFRMSFGEGWNYIMTDFAVEPPFCYSSKGVDATDCGNKPYAHILFIAWNLISMYIFLNMFVSLILESFSYVNSRSDHITLIKRQEIRKFKGYWQKYDPEGTGFIDPNNLEKLLRSLEGVLAFKIYTGRFTIPELCKAWFYRGDHPYDFELDHEAMEESLDSIDVDKVRSQRESYERFVEEAYLNMEIHNEPGISFTRLIQQIPLYVRFEPGQSLNLEDFLERQLLMQKVERRLKNKRINNTMISVIARWKYIRAKSQKKDNSQGESSSVYLTREDSISKNTPAIFVSEYDETNNKLDDESIYDVDAHYVSTSQPGALGGGDSKPGISRRSSDKYGSIAAPQSNTQFDFLSFAERDEAVTHMKQDGLMGDISRIGETLGNSQWSNALRYVKEEQDHDGKED